MDRVASATTSVCSSLMWTVHRPCIAIVIIGKARVATRSEGTWKVMVAASTRGPRMGPRAPMGMGSAYRASPTSSGHSGSPLACSSGSSGTATSSGMSGSPGSGGSDGSKHGGSTFHGSESGTFAPPPWVSQGGRGVADGCVGGGVDGGLGLVAGDADVLGGAEQRGSVVSGADGAAGGPVEPVVALPFGGLRHELDQACEGVAGGG